jgi:hypothetical protein
VSFLGKFSEKHNLDAETGFIKLFSNVFNIRLTGAEDWVDVPKYRIYPDKDWTTGVFYIKFTLDVTAPSIMTPLEGADFVKAYDAQWPLIQFTLTDAESMYAYSYVKDLVIDECEISAKVKQVRNLKVFNDLGQLDVSNPFMPFGPTPNQGSYFMIGCGELFKKKLVDLKFDIDWYDLPKGDEGFDEYFKMYANPKKTTEFEVALSALSNFEFSPKQAEHKQKFRLFDVKDEKSNPPDLRIAESQSFSDIDVKAIELHRDFDSEELLDFDGTIKAGYFKFELVSPNDPFGHAEYPELFAKAVIKNSKSKNEEELPAVPYAPQARGLSLSYQARTKIVLNYNQTRENDITANEKFYHVTPFGIKTTLKDSVPSDNHMLPQFEEDGYLLLGLERLIPDQELSLYFMMKQNVSNQFDINLPKIKWRYLVGDDWFSLEDKNVISDTTDGFTTSGIIQIKIPTDINQDHHILPSGKCWIQVSVDGDTSVLSKTVGIYTQAVEVEWQSDRDVAWRGHNPAGSITSLLEDKSEIDSVRQPETTFGGRAMESDIEFYSRIARRIKHKNRAVSAMDVELLVQYWQSDISLVKCIPTQEGLDNVPAGQSVVIVAPKVKPSKHFYLPKFSYSNLNSIESRLNGLTSSFASFKVVNPVYERFLITAGLKFVDDRNRGDYIRRLHEDLIKKLCPWFYDPSVPISIGSSVKRDEVISFIESRDYVQFATKVSIVAVTQDASGEFKVIDTANQDDLLKTVEATSPWSVMVPVSSHNFEIIDEMVHEAPEKAAIETMRLESDFVIMGEEEEEVEFAVTKDHQTYVVEINFGDK